MARHEWTVAAAKENKHSLPTSEQMQQWIGSQIIDREIQEFILAVQDIKAGVAAVGHGALPPNAHSAGILSDKCNSSTRRRGDCIQVGLGGRHVAVNHLLRITSNLENVGDFRGLLERFANSSAHHRGIIKDKAAFQQETDLRTGQNVLAVFRTGDSTTLMYFVGQVRQLVASISTTVKKKQVFLSVPGTDQTAAMFCHPWAHVDQATGDLALADEPIEYYRVHATKSVAKSQTVGDVPVDECLPVGPCDDEYGLEENVVISGSSVFLRNVQVDWSECQLVDRDAVLNAMAYAEIY